MAQLTDEHHAALVKCYEAEKTAAAAFCFLKNTFPELKHSSHQPVYDVYNRETARIFRNNLSEIALRISQPFWQQSLRKKVVGRNIEVKFQNVNFSDFVPRAFFLERKKNYNSDEKTSTNLYLIDSGT